MFSKLALRNVRRSFRDYGVYLLTLTFGVCLFYTFNSIDGQGVMVYLAQSQNPMAQLIQTILDIFSVFVAVVLACLILYANTFLIRRRKRELGTYLLLGLSQRQVSGLLVLETLVIGLISLAAGLLLGLAASQGNFELNVFMPVCIYNFLQSARLLTDCIRSFNDHCAVGITANREKCRHNLHNSLMLVTALNPYIGYDNAAKTAKKAHAEHISLKEACVSLGFLTAERFDEVFHPEEMV